MDAHAGFPGADDGAGGLVSRILQVALGLFVTTLELPNMTPNQVANLSTTFDCSFNYPCRWGSIGNGKNPWKLAKGQPDSLLWLAATRSTILPSDPFSIIEIQEGSVDMLTSHNINCQVDSAMFSFTYWTIGNADLQICLLDQAMRQFNCTGMLESKVQPGKVSLKIPPVNHPFHIAIIPSQNPGVLIVDDIKYDADFCHLPSLVSPPTLPLFSVRPPPANLLPVTPESDISFTIPETHPPIIFSSTEAATTTSNPLTITETTSDPATTTERTTTNEPETTTETTTQQPPPTSATKKETSDEDYEEEPTSTGTTAEKTETDPPFELYIMGNKTQPLFDRRRGKIIDDTQELLCSFDFNFPCFWGPEAGRWAVIDKGAIPSLEEHVNGKSELPSFPAAIVLQGTAMLASDPIRCQTGTGKLMFRYWANKKIILQVCALGYNLDSNKIQCAEQQTSDNGSEITLAVFDLVHDIKEPFTLNIVPIWERNMQNGYLILDEIAYMGECNATDVSGEEDKRWPKHKGDHKPKQVKIHQTTPSSPLMTTPEEVRPVTSKRIMNTRRPIQPTTAWPSEKESGESNVEEITAESTTEFTTSFRPPTVTFYPGLVVQRTTLKNSFTIPYTTTVRYVSTTPEPVLDYCKLLNCDFNDNACRYLNHGLTKVPWTLRNKGYGFPLSRHTDLRPTPTNGQFVSSILGPGDYAILESPRFNLTTGINVLLFQYYRPTHSSTIRLCLGTRYTKPLRTISSFLQCPPILRSLTSKNALKWNSVHIQLPPGTTHFYLVAHNLERSTEKAAIAVDNIRVAICDPRTFDATPEVNSQKEV